MPFWSVVTHHFANVQTVCAAKISSHIRKSKKKQHGRYVFVLKWKASLLAVLRGWPSDQTNGVAGASCVMGATAVHRKSVTGPNGGQQMRECVCVSRWVQGPMKQRGERGGAIPMGGLEEEKEKELGEFRCPVEAVFPIVSFAWSSSKT